MAIETVEPAFPPVSPPTRSVELLAWFGAQFDVAPPNRCAQPERAGTFLADVDVSAVWVLAHHFLLRCGGFGHAQFHAVSLFTSRMDSETVCYRLRAGVPVP